MVQFKLKEYETKILNEPIEHAYCILKNGDVYHFKGDKNTVDPSVLGDKLKGAIVTHNHPKEETEYSFGKEDFSFFEKYELVILRGCDEKYTYEFTRNPKEIDEQPLEWMNEENYQHSQNICHVMEYKVGYKRWKNE